MLTLDPCLCVRGRKGRGPRGLVRRGMECVDYGLCHIPTFALARAIFLVRAVRNMLLFHDIPNRPHWKNFIVPRYCARRTATPVLHSPPGLPYI
eukprot:scaffold6179_cov119-Isochrysis_galbana.AAC.2